MRDYISACNLPLLKIGETILPQAILGHLPFIGESYQGLKKNMEYKRRFSNIKNTVKVLRFAVERYGVTVIAAGVAPDKPTGLNKLFFKALKETEKVTKVKIAIVPCIQIPLKIDGEPVDVYRRWLTYFQAEKRRVDEKRLKSRYLNDPILQCRMGWERRFREALENLRPYGKRELNRIYVDYDRIDEMISRLEDFNPILIELGSETDLLAIGGRIDLLNELTGYLHERTGCNIILGVHHAGSTIPILDRSEVKFEGYVTPINKLGVMMFPTREDALRSIMETEKAVIAIKPFAGGRIHPEEALKHVYCDLKVKFCMLGVSSISEVEEDFSTVLRILRFHQQVPEKP